MAEEVGESDKLRSPERVCEPDSRTHMFVNINRKTGAITSKIIENHFQSISRFTLNEDVPKDVATHFETAKNLYLYAWFVYRFYTVAEQQALASLEFALRERFKDFVKEHSRKRGFGLKKLLSHAVESKCVKNEMFSSRDRWAMNRAKSRYSFQKMKEMMDAGVTSWVEDESEIVVAQEDIDYDWLGDIQETIPKIRNSHAHGSSNLYPASVYRTFEIVSEIINQLYPSSR